MTALLAAIPPPPFADFEIGPLRLRMYGIMIGLGVLAAVWLFGKLMEERGIGTTDDAGYIALWGVGAGVIGARFYHVITSWSQYKDNLGDAFKFWTPGLGIPGGILFGTLAGLWAAKRRGIPVLPALSCAAPALPLAQAIGRWGNYFNQELYGRPTNLPWGLRVDPGFITQSVQQQYPGATVFHPTFLYESLWNLGLCLALLWLFRNRPRLQPGRLFPLYLVGYGLGRLWVESLRIDPANKIGPFRVNIWMSLGLIIGGAAWFVMTRDSTERWPRPATTGGGLADEVDDRIDENDDGTSIDGVSSDDGVDNSSDASEVGSRSVADEARDASSNADKRSSPQRSSSETSPSAVDSESRDGSGEEAAATASAGVGEAENTAHTSPKKASKKKASTKKTTAKKTTAKTTAAKKTAEKKTAKKTAARKTAKKTAEKSSTSKRAAKKRGDADASTGESGSVDAGSIDPGLSMGSDPDDA